MARRLILDTGILVRAERGTTWDAEILPDDDLVIASITLAELLTGVELASDAHRAARQSFVAGLVDILPVEPYDSAVAAAHAQLLAHVHRSGTPRGAHDLIIAATAIATGRTLVTNDRRARFSDLPRLDCLTL